MSDRALPHSHAVAHSPVFPIGSPSIYDEAGVGRGCTDTVKSVTFKCRICFLLARRQRCFMLFLNNGLALFLIPPLTFFWPFGLCCFGGVVVVYVMLNAYGYHAAM